MSGYLQHGQLHGPCALLHLAQAAMWSPWEDLVEVFCGSLGPSCSHWNLRCGRLGPPSHAVRGVHLPAEPTTNGPGWQHKRTVRGTQWSGIAKYELPSRCGASARRRGAGVRQALPPAQGEGPETKSVGGVEGLHRRVQALGLPPTAARNVSARPRAAGQLQQAALGPSAPPCAPRCASRFKCRPRRESTPSPAPPARRPWRRPPTRRPRPPPATPPCSTCWWTATCATACCRTRRRSAARANSLSFSSASAPARRPQPTAAAHHPAAPRR